MKLYPNYQLETLLDKAPCGFLSFADDGTIVLANATLLQLLGYESDGLWGQQIASILPIASRIFHQTYFLPLLKLHGKAAEIYFSLRSKQGSDIPVLIEAVRREQSGSFVNDCVCIPLRQTHQPEDRVPVSITSPAIPTIAIDQHQHQGITHLLRKITAQINQSLDLSSVFSTAVQEVRQLMRADCVGIFQFNPDHQLEDGHFVAESSLEKYKSALALSSRDYYCSPQCTFFYQQGQIQAITDSRALLSPSAEKTPPPMRASLLVPIMNCDGLWGLLCINQCATPRAWQELEIGEAQLVADQLAIAIQQTNLRQHCQYISTERRLAEIRLTAAQDQLALSQLELANAQRLKEEFLASMSHELRTPLNAILGMSEALQEEVYGSLNERQIRATALIEKSGTHLLQLINNILDLAQANSNKLTLQVGATTAENLCKASIQTISQTAQQKNVRVMTHIPRNIDVIEVDEQRIIQVLINLLDNAIKFTPAEGQVSLEVNLDRKHQKIQFKVADTGIGIAAEQLPQLFQIFVQGDGNLNRSYEGTGLGLALVKHIVQLHHGTIEAISALGQGSQFTVTLPLRQP